MWLQRHLRSGGHGNAILSKKGGDLIKSSWFNEKKEEKEKNSIPLKEMVKLSKIVIAGNLSKKDKQKFYSPDTLKAKRWKKEKLY